MPTIWLSSKTMTGVVMMFVGVVLINTNMRLPVINDMTQGNTIPQLILAIVLLVMGFVTFSKPLKRVTEKQKTRKTLQKSRNEFLEIFGLE